MVHTGIFTGKRKNGENMKTENRKTEEEEKSKAKFVMERRSEEGQMSGVGISRTLGPVEVWGKESDFGEGSFGHWG